MLLPRGKKEMGQPEVGPGFYPPAMHRLSVPDDPDQWEVDHSYSVAHSVEVMAKIKGVGRGKKYNLMAQVIPIYGFGILLYILYIIYKLTCKGKTNKSASHTTVSRANTQNTIINDYELARLQERLLQTEQMMERIVSGKAHCSGRRRKSKTTTSKKEEKLLKELRQITQLMQEGRLEGASPEMEAEEVPYDAEWEGYPEETYPEYEESRDRPRFKMMKLEGQLSQPTAEALAERMEQEEEEIMARKLSVVQEEDEEEEDREVEKEEKEEEEEEEEDGEDEEVVEGIEEKAEEIVEEEEEEEEEEEAEAEAEKKQLLSLPPPPVERKQERLGLEVSNKLQYRSGAKKQISFSDRKDVFRYPREETYEGEEEEKEDEAEEEDEGTEMEGEEEEEEEGDDEDPVMEAESLQFSCEGASNPEEEAEEDAEEYSLSAALEEDGGRVHADVVKDVGVSGLRMRNRRET